VARRHCERCDELLADRERRLCDFCLAIVAGEADPDPDDDPGWTPSGNL
jgi:hypothetical protein